MNTLSNTPPGGVAVTRGIPDTAWSHNERDDAYAGEIVRLSARLVRHGAHVYSS